MCVPYIRTYIYYSKHYPEGRNCQLKGTAGERLENDEIKSRFCLRPGFLEAIKKTGVEVVGVRRTDHGMEVEFKLPWENVSGFEAEAGKVITLDSELCYGDGDPRLFRTFALGAH